MTVSTTQNRPRTYPMTVVAQDPKFRVNGRILTTTIDVQAEQLAPGPAGARVKVIDYDASSGTLYKPFAGCVGKKTGEYADCLKDRLTNDVIEENPWFHAQNVYAITMSTLARFEKALGRRLAWGFGGHQLYIAPHAFCEANAFYSEQDRALLFGYFPNPFRRQNKTVYCCLSYDIVAHEATHALLDGVRNRFTEPSSLDQDGFHEGFADIVALLSVLASKDLVAALLARGSAAHRDTGHLPLHDLAPERLKQSVLFTLADEMGEASAEVRGEPLRASLTIPLDTSWRSDEEFAEPHRHGELLVAAILHTFADVWHRRIMKLAEGLGRTGRDAMVQIELLAEEGATAAASLLNVIIRALDYTAPTHVTYKGFLSALLTADEQVVPDDSRYHYRETLRTTFAALGIKPSSRLKGGVWEPVGAHLRYDRVRFESILRDPEEMYRFIWDNRRALEIEDGAYTKVESVRPVARTTPDGFYVRETVAEYTQRITLPASRLSRLRIRQPDALADDEMVTLWGGGTLLFDEYGQVKFHIRNKLLNRDKQEQRLKYLAESGYYSEDTAMAATFGRRHLARMLGTRAFRRNATF